MILNSVRVNFLVALMFLLGNIQLSYGKTEDQCWRTTSDTSAAKDLFLYEEPSIFLSKMLEEFQRMRGLFPAVNEQEEKEYKTLFDKKYSKKYISPTDEDRLVVLEAKRQLDIFIDNMIEVFSYQNTAKNGDVLGYLFAVNILNEADLEEIGVSFMVAEAFFIGAKSESDLASYISNVGSYISALNKHILLCVIPKSL
jgi:hypothetical protein